MQHAAFFKRYKVHLVFGGGILVYFVVYTIVNLWAGETPVGAIISALRSVKPFEYVMTAGLWYVIANQREPERRHNFTTLDLGNSNS